MNVGFNITIISSITVRLSFIPYILISLNNDNIVEITGTAHKESSVSKAMMPKMSNLHAVVSFATNLHSICTTKDIHNTSIVPFTTGK